MNQTLSSFDREEKACCWNEENETSQPVPSITSLCSSPFMHFVSSRVFPPPCLTAWAQVTVYTEKKQAAIWLAIAKLIMRWDLRSSRGSIQKLSNPSTELYWKYRTNWFWRWTPPALPPHPASSYSCHITRQAYGPLHLSIHLWVRVSACPPAWNACDGCLSSPRRRRTRRGNFLFLLSTQNWVEFNSITDYNFGKLNASAGLKNTGNILLTLKKFHYKER